MILYESEEGLVKLQVFSTSLCSFTILYCTPQELIKLPQKFDGMSVTLRQVFNTIRLVTC